METESATFGSVTDWIILLCILALAGLAIRGTSARVKDALKRIHLGDVKVWPWLDTAFYVGSIVIGGALGAVILWEIGSYWTLGMAAGVGAMVLGVQVKSAFVRRIK